MEPESRVQLKTWTKTLPYSRIVYPQSAVDKVKYLFWRVYTPYHPFFRDACLKLGLLEHDERQDFILGKIAPSRSVEELVSFLIGQGYGNHFIAWKDNGEVVGLRKVVDFTRQYHIRIFDDGEVRGHYEYTPEAYPFLHMKKIGMEERRQEFMSLLKNLVV